MADLVKLPYDMRNDIMELFIVNYISPAFYLTCTKYHDIIKKKYVSCVYSSYNRENSVSCYTHNGLSINYKLNQELCNNAFMFNKVCKGHTEVRLCERIDLTSIYNRSCLNILANQFKIDSNTDEINLKKLIQQYIDCRVQRSVVYKG